MHTQVDGEGSANAAPVGAGVGGGDEEGGALVQGEGHSDLSAAGAPCAVAFCLQIAIGWLGMYQCIIRVLLIMQLCNGVGQIHVNP